MQESEVPQIIVKNLWKIYGKDSRRIFSKDFESVSKDKIQKETGCIVGLRNINLTIKKGEFFVFMGLSGSGKSTLIRSLILLVNPTNGSIIINGSNVTGMNRDQLLQFRRKTFGMVFQHYGLLPHLTVLENAAYGLKVKGVPKKERHEKALRVLEIVGLGGWEHYRPGSLSGGMQQRVGLARAFANDAEILLMDEPFSGLDPLIRRQMQDELIELQDKLQKTIIFVTHDLHEALKMGDKISMMRDGEIVQTGTPEEILTQPADSYVQEFAKDAFPAKVLTAGSIMEPAKLLIYDWEGPRTALAHLQSNNRKSAFVVDKTHTIKGIIREERLKKLLAQNERPEKLSEISLKQVPHATAETILEDLFPLVTQNPYPIAVVDDKNKFQGIVTTDLIFESISPVEGENDV